MTTARRAGLYVRISDDRLGDEAGVARQEQDCRKLAERLGWAVAEVYPENDVSAFKRRKLRLPDGAVALRVQRPAYRRLLTDLASGAINALVAYDLDRVARDPRDLEDLIDVVEQNNTPNRAVTGNLDLSTDSGIAMARVITAMNNKSSRDTSRRLARKHEEMAEKGTYSGGGQQPYGFQADRVTVDEDQAEVVRDMARKALDGKSLLSIAKDLNASDIPTATNNPKGWQARSVHSVLTAGRVAGLRRFRGELVGDASWPAILDRDTWDRVQMALGERDHGSGNKLEKWLNGVLFCGRCRNRLYGWSRGKYWCANANRLGGCGKTVIHSDHAEGEIERQILAYLSRPDVAEALMESTSSSSLASARADAKADEEQLKELATAWAKRDITMPEYLTARKEIEARLSQWRTIVRESTPGCVRALLTAEDLTAAWEGLQPVDKRDVAWVVYPRGIEVLPHTGSQFTFDASRLRRIGESEDWSAE